MDDLVDTTGLKLRHEAAEEAVETPAALAGAFNSEVYIPIVGVGLVCLRDGVIEQLEYLCDNPSGLSQIGKVAPE